MWSALSWGLLTLISVEGGVGPVPPVKLPLLLDSVTPWGGGTLTRHVLCFSPAPAPDFSSAAASCRLRLLLGRIVAFAIPSFP